MPNQRNLSIRNLPIKSLPKIWAKWNLPIRSLPIGNLPISRELFKLMPVCSSHIPFMLQYHKIGNKTLIQGYFVAKWVKPWFSALVERVSSISVDLLSIFSTTNKTCKEMVKEDNFSYKYCLFPALMSRLRNYCRENVENYIYALWWAGLA